MAPAPDDEQNQFQIIAELFDELSELPMADRQARLRMLAQQDTGIAAEVQSLLDSQDAHPNLLERPLTDLNQAQPMPGHIGAYRVLGRLGQGGMGTVYRALRDDGSYSQQVALKLVYGGANTPDSQARFINERQILAQLNHPDITRLLDGGTTPDGSAYLVMELVDGLPIDQYCTQHQLELEARLRLFIRVCLAVDFAHRNLVVHRDIKPANVQVNNQGQPKILDFGIAKLLTSNALDLTRTGLLPMTPEYASPEQVTGAQITVASDVYALGALLFKLLTGRTPVALDGLTLEKALERILRTPPGRPSQTPGVLAGVGAELDAILAKALRKEPEQRYATAAELARDIERHLAGHPVSAQPDTWLYRSRKFASRHKLAVASTLVVSLSLFTATGIALWQASEATQQRDQAELARSRATQEAARAEQILGFLENTLASANPEQAQGKELTVRELLDKTAQALPSEALEPSARIGILQTLAQSYLSLGLADQGRPLAEEAAQLATEALGEDAPLTLTAQHMRAKFMLLAGDYNSAITLMESTLERRKRVLGQHLDTTATMANLAVAYAGVGRLEDALALDLAQLEITRALTGPDSDETLRGLINVGTDYYDLGRYTEATNTFTEVLGSQKRRHGEKHPVTLSSMNNLAVLLRKSGDNEGAERMHLSTLALRREVLGERHPDTLNSLNNLGELYLVDGQLEQALPLLQEAYAGRLAVFGPGHEDTLESMVSLSRIYLRQQQAEAAEDWARRALLAAQSSEGENIKAASYATTALVEALLAEGRYADALQFTTSELQRRWQQLGEQHPETLEMLELNSKALAEAETQP